MIPCNLRKENVLHLIKNIFFILCKDEKGNDPNINQLLTEYWHILVKCPGIASGPFSAKAIPGPRPDIFLYEINN